MTIRYVEYKDVSPEMRIFHKMKKDELLKISEKKTGTFIDTVKAEDVVNTIQ